MSGSDRIGWFLLGCGAGALAFYALMWLFILAAR